MSIIIKHSKKALTLILTIYTTCLLSLPAQADGTAAALGAGGGALAVTEASADTFLPTLAGYAHDTLTTINQMSDYLALVAQLAVAWISPDKSTETATLQKSFSTYTGETAASNAAQIGLQQQLLTDYFGTTSATPPPPNYANDLAYQTLLGIPVWPSDPRIEKGQPNNIDSAYNYIKYAAGLNMPHTIPGNNWTGNTTDQKNYYGYYTAISAVATYNAYVLSQLYTDSKNGIPTTEATLIQQASDPTQWFAQIAGESIGIVLRQILMYNSQMYILLFQILQTEKQQLATQAMTNTLLMIQGKTSEAVLLRRAVTQTSS